MPSELQAGCAEMSLFGYAPDDETALRATTAPIKLRIEQSGFSSSGSEVVPPTPDLYQQLIAKIDEKIASVHDGADGASAYEIAVENGYTGTEAEWLSSLKGEKGDTGEQPFSYFILLRFSINSSDVSSNLVSFRSSLCICSL